MSDFALARRNMVESQIRTNKVVDERLIDALSEVPRETFVAKSLRGIAYVDEDLALGRGRFLMEPMVLARLLQEARIKPTDIVLDVACGTGYACAVTSRLASTVVGLDEDRGFVREAMANLAALGIENVAVVEGPLADGYAKQGPYDVILVNGAVERMPERLHAQLADGGRLVTVVRETEAPVGRATLFLKRAGIVSHRVLFDACTPLLGAFRAEPTFSF